MSLLSCMCVPLINTLNMSSNIYQIFESFFNEFMIDLLEVLFLWSTLTNTGTLLKKLHFSLISLNPAPNCYVKTLPFLRLKMMEYWQFHKVQLSITSLVYLFVHYLSPAIWPWALCLHSAAFSELSAQGWVYHRYSIKTYWMNISMSKWMTEWGDTLCHINQDVRNQNSYVPGTVLGHRWQMGKRLLASLHSLMWKITEGDR